MKRALALTAMLVAGLVLAMFASRTPQPPSHAASGAFDTARAMVDISAIARQGHPIGTAENARVRDYLTDRLKGLGLEVRTQSGETLESRARGDRALIAGGHVENLIGVLPGKDRSLPPLAVQAHYDSVANSPGAADDATGVGVLLDVARALKAKGQPARDVLFLITDGEEAGLLGARSFYASDPLAKRIGLVLNMEARGGGGRVSMFETSDGNGGLIKAMRGFSPGTTSTSLAVFIYKLMPNDTDLTVVKETGLRGMNWAFIGRQFDYHAGSSTPANLDRGTVEHMGRQVLAAAQAFAFSRDLPKASPDLVYSDLLGGPILAYPQWAGWLVWLVAGAVGAVAIRRAWREEPRSWVEPLKGAGALLLATLVAGLLAYGARKLTGAPIDFTGQRPLLAQFGRFESALTLLCLASLSLITAWLGGRRPWGGWAGALALGWLLTGVLQLLAPPVAFLVAWPVLAATLIAAVAAFAGKAELDAPISLAGFVVLGGLMLGQLLYMAHFVALGVGADMPSALAIFVLLAGLILLPLGWSVSRRRLAIAGCLFLAVGLALVLAVRLTDPSSPRHPRATEVYYLTDADAGKAWRVSAMPDADPWTHKVLTADGGKAAARPLRGFGEKLLLADAAPIAAARPQASITQEADGRTRIRFTQSQTSREIRLSILSDKPIASAEMSGQTVKMQAKRLTLLWSSPGRPAEVALQVPADARLDVKAVELTEGWPRDAKPLPPRPADAMAWGNSDATLSMATVR
jgi:hypothetical protein